MHQFLSNNKNNSNNFLSSNEEEIEISPIQDCHITETENIEKNVQKLKGLFEKVKLGKMRVTFVNGSLEFTDLG